MTDEQIAAIALEHGFNNYIGEQDAICFGRAILAASASAELLTADDVERQYQDGIHIGSGLPRETCPCGFCKKHRHGFNQSDAAEPQREMTANERWAHHPLIPLSAYSNATPSAENRTAQDDVRDAQRYRKAVAIGWLNTLVTENLDQMIEKDKA